MAKLTALQVANTRQRGLYGDGGGLYLQIAANGSRSWIFRYRDGERQRYHGLGPVESVSLAEAREAAQQCRKLRLQGIDPIAAKQRRLAALKLEEARALSFADCAEQYIAAHRSGWKNPKHAQQWQNTLATYAYPVFGDLPVAAVDVTLVLKVIESIWAVKAETASRLRGRIEAVLDWAKVRGFRTGENPAQWKGNLAHLLPPRVKVRRVKHHAALPHGEMNAFWADLVTQAGTAAMALRFVILTAARTSEVLNATWDEVDGEGAVWTIPAERMKGGKAHRVPLSSQALAVLAEMRRHGTDGMIFPGRKAGSPLSNIAMLATLRRMGRGDLTTHGFRSTFRDWTAECTDVPREVAEAALAHTLDNKVEAAYRRSDLFDKRRALMESWAEYCLGKKRR